MNIVGIAVGVTVGILFVGIAIAVYRKKPHKLTKMTIVHENEMYEHEGLLGDIPWGEPNGV